MSAPTEVLDPTLAYKTIAGHFLPESHLNVVISLSHRGDIWNERRYVIQCLYPNLRYTSPFGILIPFSVRQNTRTSCSKGARYITAENVLCVEENDDIVAVPESIKCSEVEFEFSDASGRFLYLSLVRIQRDFNSKSSCY
jgi:hypothetical protein